MRKSDGTELVLKIQYPGVAEAIRAGAENLRHAVAELERAWKVSSIVRSAGATSMALTASFADLQEWVKIKKGLESSRLIRDLNIESLSVAGADVSFNFSGRPDQLATDLRSRTQGRATYSMHFDRYEPAPSNVSEEVVARMQGK